MSSLNDLHDYIEPTLIDVIKRHGKREQISRLVDPVHKMIAEQMEALYDGEVKPANPALAAKAMHHWQSLSKEDQRAVVQELLWKYRQGEMAAGCFNSCAAWIVAIAVIVGIVFAVRAIW